MRRSERSLLSRWDSRLINNHIELSYFTNTFRSRKITLRTAKKVLAEMLQRRLEGKRAGDSVNLNLLKNL